jgi:hypothetical protein
LVAVVDVDKMEMLVLMVDQVVEAVVVEAHQVEQEVLQLKEIVVVELDMDMLVELDRQDQVMMAVAAVVLAVSELPDLLNLEMVQVVLEYRHPLHLEILPYL